MDRKRSAAAADVVASDYHDDDKKKQKVSHDEKFQNMLERLELYKESYGDCLVPYRWAADPQLGKWVNSQRLLHDQGKLSSRRIRQLEKVGFIWRVKQRLLWDEMYDRLVSFKEKHGHCLVPQRYKHDPQLGRWVDTQRENRDRRLTAEHKKRLDEIGFVWSALKESWDEMYNRLVEYKKQHGDCQVTQRYAADPKLGKWVKNQRLRRDCLSQERIDRLEEIGFVWCVQKKQERDSWDSKFKKLQKYKAEHGNCLVSANYKEDPSLAMWVQSHRQSKGSLTAHQVKRLDSIGFEWTLPEEKSMTALLWDAMFDHLVRYKEQYGSCQVITTPGRGDLAALSLWVERQRASRRFGGLSRERQERLERIGFVWEGERDYLWTRSQQDARVAAMRATDVTTPFRRMDSYTSRLGTMPSDSLLGARTAASRLGAATSLEFASMPPATAPATYPYMTPLLATKRMKQSGTTFPNPTPQDIMLFGLLDKGANNPNVGAFPVTAAAAAAARGRPVVTTAQPPSAAVTFSTSTTRLPSLAAAARHELASRRAGEPDLASLLNARRALAASRLQTGTSGLGAAASLRATFPMGKKPSGAPFPGRY